MANRNLRDGKDFRDKLLFLSDDKTTSQKRNRFTGSVYILFLEPERFYIYGFFFFFAQCVLYRLEYTCKVCWKKSTQRYMNIFVLCTWCTKIT